MLMGNTAASLVASLSELMKSVAESTCTFVFCLLPSQAGSSHGVSLSYLTSQVNALALAHLSTFHQQAFAVRMKTKDFLKRYVTLTNRHKSRWRRTVAMDTKARVDATYVIIA